MDVIVGSSIVAWLLVTFATRPEPESPTEKSSGRRETRIGERGTLVP
jgi:hypothetical protein